MKKDLRIKKILRMMASHIPERNRAGGGRLENVSGALLVRRFSVRQPEIFRVIEAVSEQRLTAMDKATLCELAQTAMDSEYDNLAGDFIQVGCGLGGAAIVLAHAKHRSRAFLVHDPFSKGADAEKRARQVLTAHGADERLNVQLIPGAYEKTLVTDGALALAQVDCGEFEPMRVLLERLVPRLVSGAHMIIDDYKTSEECHRAVDDYFRGKSGFELVRKSRLHVIKS